MSAVSRAPAIEVLFDTEESRPQTEAERRYGGALRFPDTGSPYVVSNFVSTMDGVVSLRLHDGTDAGVVGGHSAADRFVMAMLRAAVDAVVIGATTLADSSGHQWTPVKLVPDAADDLLEYRRALGRPDAPAPLVIVSGSGRLASHVALREPATHTILVTTQRGATQAGGVTAETIVVDGGESIDAAGMVALFAERGWRTVLCEGGPRLMGTLIARDAVRDVFLTIAPQIAGRDDSHPRPGMVEGFAAREHSLQRYDLWSARRSGSHLLLRYRHR